MTSKKTWEYNWEKYKINKKKSFEGLLQRNLVILTSLKIILLISRNIEKKIEKKRRKKKECWTEKKKIFSEAMQKSLGGCFYF
jgi:hypothetical protein